MKNSIKDIDFVAYVMSFTTVAYGLYIFNTDRYIIDRFSLLGVSNNAENMFGLFILAAAVIKLLGLKTQNKVLKRIGIVSLIVVWSLVVGVYIFEALKLQFLGLTFTLPVLVLCLRIARRGDFVE